MRVISKLRPQHLPEQSLLRTLSCGALIVLALAVGTPTAVAQDVALKTNLLYDATATVNAGVEVRLSSRWTLDLSGNYNAWTLSHDRCWKHWMLQPEARRWFCDPFIGHFLGFHLHGGKFNVGGLDNDISFFGTDFSKLSDHRYQGWAVGAGVGYGYSWVLGKHWNIEGEIGLGYSYVKYDRYPCAECGTKEGEGKHHYVGPTKAAVNLIYSF